ncbi:hypothetical protein BJX99DRAFT_263231 [Aspergillus californicus]
MHIAFLSNPASGQVNVQLATAQELVSQEHAVTFLSAETCSTKIDRFRMAQEPCHRHLIHFISLGSGHTVNDFTAFIQTRMHLMRRVPGDPVSLETCIEAALGPAEEHATTALWVRDHIDSLNPDMICVDGLTPSLITGVRLTKRKFILTIPCSPGLTALPGAFQPHLVAAKRGGSWGTFFENIYLNLHEVIHSRRHPDRRAKRKVVKRLGLKSYGAASDSALFPPHWEDDNCVAGIHFNTSGLIDCPKQSSKIIFVGAGVANQPPSTPSPTTISPEIAWMNEAALLNQDVVYINMGSMFIWHSDEFESCMSGFKAAHEKLRGRVRFIVKINSRPSSSSGDEKKEAWEDTLPPYIRLTHWIEDQQGVYSHPALKVFIHHGGGNSFNEAVHFAVPQLVLGQWLDTHEYANYAETFGLGLRNERPPYIAAEDIESKLLTLLGPKWPTFKATCNSWALRSQLGGGAVSAAKFILFHAEAGGVYTPQRFSTELTPPLSPVQLSRTLSEKEPAIICS